MANILVSLSGLVDLVHKTSYANIISNLDKLVEKYSKDYKPLLLPDGSIVPHSESQRYSNGELKPDYEEITESSIAEEDLQQLIMHNEQRLAFQTDIRLLVNYAKITVHNAVILANDANNFNPTREIYYLVRQNIPEIILNDDELIDQCFPTNLEKDLFNTPYEMVKDTLTDKHIKEFKDKTTYPEALEIFERMYTLRLLTNV